ncbi:MAG: hypothetical protein CMM44_09870 [Rhodospirillaceae bacterium]|nr:hypothetical protein [Rhodospirillaceae bacterium]
MKVILSTSNSSDDSYYEGEWKNNKFHGPGFLKTKNRKLGGYDLHKGLFQIGKKHGLGKMIHVGSSGKADKEFILSYVGEWKDNQKHGFGIERVYNRKFVGGFRNGLRHGKGVMSFNGKKIIQTFVDGKLYRPKSKPYKKTRHQDVKRSHNTKLKFCSKSYHFCSGKRIVDRCRSIPSLSQRRSCIGALSGPRAALRAQGFSPTQITLGFAACLCR